MPLDNKEAIANLLLARALSDKAGDMIPRGTWHRVSFDCYRRDANHVHIGEISVMDLAEGVKNEEVGR